LGELKTLQFLFGDFLTFRKEMEKNKHEFLRKDAKPNAEGIIEMWMKKVFLRGIIVSWVMAFPSKTKLLLNSKLAKKQSLTPNI
jgi:hypothetical protein